MDLDVDAEKIGFGLYCYYPAAAIIITAVLITLGFGLYCCYAAVATTTINLAITAAANQLKKGYH